MNKKIFISIIFSFLINFVLIINVDAINASEIAETNTGKYCRVTSTAGSQVRVRIGFENGASKYGIFYNMTMGVHNVNGSTIGAPAFCLNPGKSNNTTYKAKDGEPLSRVTNKWYYIVYQWYLNNRAVYGERALLYAQTAIWSLANNNYNSAEKLKKTLAEVYYTSVCKDYQTSIRQKIKNPNFSCECYMTEPRKRDDSCDEKVKDGETLEELDLEYYFYLFEHGEVFKYENGQYYGMSDYRKDMQEFTSVATSILNASNPLYPGDLYEWTASNGSSDYQNLLGIYGCTDNQTVQTCDEDLNNLKRTFHFDTQDKTVLANNPNWIRKLDELAVKYPQYAVGLKNYSNPTCPNDTTTPPSCDPEYTEKKCEFDGPNGGFLFKDAGADPNENTYCWLENGIAYNVDGNQVDSNYVEEDFSNAYCDIYCWEAFGADFPSAVQGIKAGTTFFWGIDKQDGTFGNVNARRYCKTVGINYNLFHQHWKDNENEIALRYAEYMAQVEYNKESNLKTNGTSCNASENRDMCVMEKVEKCDIGYAGPYDGKCYNHSIGDWLEDNKCSNGSKGTDPGSGLTTCIIATKDATEEDVCGSCKDGISCPEGGSVESDDKCYRYEGLNAQGGCNRGIKVGNQCKISMPTATADYELSNGSCYLQGKEYYKEQKSKQVIGPYGEITGHSLGTSDKICIANNITSSTQINNKFSTVTVGGTSYNLSSNLTSRKYKLNKELDDRKGLANEIEECQTNKSINQDTIYKFNSTVTLNYTDPAVSRTIKTLQLEHDAIKDSKTFTDGGAQSGQLPLYCVNMGTDFSDTSGKCGVSFLWNLPQYSEYHWDFSGTYNFKYNIDSFYWKALIESKTIINKDTEVTNTVGDLIEPYEVGYGIPTSFTLVKGFYDISVKVTGFGNNGEHFNSLVAANNDGQSIYNYACKYYVENPLYYNECRYNCYKETQTCVLDTSYKIPDYCPPPGSGGGGGSGIDLVYRLIEMPTKDAGRQKVVFPSIDGDGRTPGNNWEEFIAAEPTGFKNITNFDVIYNNSKNISGPIYEIELTPTAINEIRKDTLTYRTRGIDPYTSYTDANNQEKVICEGNEPDKRTCASEYITTLIQDEVITSGYYVDCQQCSNTSARLDWIDSQKERFYNN